MELLGNPVQYRANESIPKMTNKRKQLRHTVSLMIRVIGHWHDQSSLISSVNKDPKYNTPCRHVQAHTLLQADEHRTTS